MTSKQALDKLCEFGDLYENEECRKVIEKDLEVLEILKKYVSIRVEEKFAVIEEREEYCGGCYVFPKEEELKKIREWVK